MVDKEAEKLKEKIEKQRKVLEKIKELGKK